MNKPLSIPQSIDSLIINPQLTSLPSSIINDKDFTHALCSRCTEFLESLWLQVTDSFRPVSIENSLILLTTIIPTTIEHSLHEFFWDSNLRAYRVIKAAVGLFSSIHFAVSKTEAEGVNALNFLELAERDNECVRRKEIILDMMIAAVGGQSSAWAAILGRGVVPVEGFLWALLSGLVAEKSELIQKTLKLIVLLAKEKVDLSGERHDLVELRGLMAARKSVSQNTVMSFFATLNIADMNKVLNALALACHTLERSENLQCITKFLLLIFNINPTFTLSLRILPIIRVILSSSENSNLHAVFPSLSLVLYLLSLNREFSVSLSITESNLLLKLIFNIIQIPDYAAQSYFPYLLGTFCNISAFLISIDQHVSLEITKAYEYLLNKSWLLSAEKNHLNIFYIYKALSNIIQYQWESGGYLWYYIIKKKESFYRAIRMQVDTAEEPCLDDKATDGELEDSDSLKSRSDDDNEIGDNQEVEEEEEKGEYEGKEISESSEEEGQGDEEGDRVIELERISQGLLLGLNAVGPDEVVQRTSYLNTHVSTFSEDVDRRNTVQHIEIARREEWKPTPEWILVWKTQLPTKAVFIMIRELFSAVIEMQERKSKVEEIVRMIEDCTLVGILPRPHPIFYVRNLEIDIELADFV